MEVVLDENDPFASLIRQYSSNNGHSLNQNQNENHSDFLGDFENDTASNMNTNINMNMMTNSNEPNPLMPSADSMGSNVMSYRRNPPKVGAVNSSGKAMAQRMEDDLWQMLEKQLATE